VRSAAWPDASAGFSTVEAQAPEALEQRARFGGFGQARDRLIGALGVALGNGLIRRSAHATFSGAGTKRPPSLGKLQEESADHLSLSQLRRECSALRRKSCPCKLVLRRCLLVEPSTPRAAAEDRLYTAEDADPCDRPGSLHRVGVG